jgi:hypothetical protein
MWVFLLFALAAACQNETCPSKVCISDMCACQISTSDDLKPHNEICMCKAQECKPSKEVTSTKKNRITGKREVVKADKQQYCFDDGCRTNSGDVGLVVGVVVAVLGLFLILYVSVSLWAYDVLKREGSEDPCTEAWRDGFWILDKRCFRNQNTNPPVVVNGVMVEDKTPVVQGSLIVPPNPPVVNGVPELRL